MTLLGGSDRYANRTMLEEIKALGGGIREIGIRLNESGMHVISE